MRRLNMDAVSAIVLLLFIGAMFYASFNIEVTDYNTLQPSLWPRLILLLMAAFALLLLVRSIAFPAHAASQAVTEGGDNPLSGGEGFSRDLSTYINPLVVFALFLLFVATLRWLGMLLGGAAFVFLALTLMGRNDVRSVAVHLAVAVLSVGAMWAIFTFALGVILPAGELLPKV